MSNLILLGQVLLLITIIAVASYVFYILCLLFIKLIDIVKRFTEWFERKLFNNLED